MFEMKIRVPHVGSDSRCDTTLLARRHEVRVVRYLDSLQLGLAAAIRWEKLGRFTRAVCMVTSYPEVRAA